MAIRDYHGPHGPLEDHANFRPDHVFVPDIRADPEAAGEAEFDEVAVGFGD